MSASQQSLSFDPDTISNGAHTLKYVAELSACVQKCADTTQADESLAKEQAIVRSVAESTAHFSKGASQAAQAAVVLSKMIPLRRPSVSSEIVKKLVDRIETSIDANKEVMVDSKEPHLVLDHPGALKMEGAGVIYMDEETRQARRAYQQAKGKYVSLRK